jgi:hypothetical protein
MNPQTRMDIMTVEITFRGKVYRQLCRVPTEMIDDPKNRRDAVAHVVDMTVSPVIDQLLDDYTEKWFMIPGSKGDG